MSHFHTLRVSAIHRLTPTAVSISLSPANGGDFGYRAGQYLTFKFMHEGEELRRSYSLCSAPHEEQLMVGVKEVENGRISGYLNRELKVGDEIQSMLPEGNFVLPQMDSPKHVVLFAAGSGITPVYSIIKEVLKQKAGHKITLFYGNRSVEETMFGEELKQLAAQEDKFDIHLVYSDGSTGTPLFSGRINFGKATELLYNFCSDDWDKEFFICGPGGMMQSVNNALLDRGVPVSSIHMEYFEAPDTQPQQETTPAEESDFEGTAKVEVILDDEEFEFELSSKGPTILNAALDEGADAPYSCKGGVCTTCRAKVLKGKVVMDNDFTLTDSEKEEGYVLTCQSHPASAEVVVSYDD